MVKAFMPYSSQLQIVELLPCQLTVSHPEVVGHSIFLSFKSECIVFVACTHLIPPTPNCQRPSVANKGNTFNRRRENRIRIGLVKHLK